MAIFVRSLSPRIMTTRRDFLKRGSATLGALAVGPSLLAANSPHAELAKAPGTVPLRVHALPPVYTLSLIHI